MKPSGLILLSALGTRACNPGGERGDLADEAVEGDRAHRGRQRHRHRLPRGVRAALHATRPEHRRGEPCRRRDDDRCQPRRQGGPGWLHHSRHFIRARDRAGALSEPELSSGARLCRGRRARHLAVRPGGSAGQGLQDSPRSRRCSQGEAGYVQLLLARRRDGIASERGTLPVERRRAGRARSVQGRCRGNDRSDRGTDRLLLRGARCRPAAHQGRQALCACGEWRRTLGRVAGGADHPGSRLRQCRVSDVVRTLPAGEDAARDRRQASSRDAQGTARRPR